MTASAPDDLGASAERTALAWQRTGLAVVVASVAVLRLATLRGSVTGVVVAVGAALLAVVALVRVRSGYRREDVSSVPGTMGPAAAVTVAIALLGAAAALVELA